MTTSGANNTLDLQGKLNVVNPVTISPNGGTVNLDGVNLTKLHAPGAPP